MQMCQEPEALGPLLQQLSKVVTWRLAEAERQYGAAHRKARAESNVPYGQFFMDGKKDKRPIEARNDASYWQEWWGAISKHVCDMRQMVADNPDVAWTKENVITGYFNKVLANYLDTFELKIYREGEKTEDNAILAKVWEQRGNMPELLKRGDLITKLEPILKSLCRTVWGQSKPKSLERNQLHKSVSMLNRLASHKNGISDLLTELIQKQKKISPAHV